jgi:prepilin-type N-terminal cleavage/methylation domain-containing protein
MLDEGADQTGFQRVDIAYNRESMNKQASYRMNQKIPATQLTKEKRSGFTLVELLVVIGIIAILIGILIPIIGSVKRSAYKADTLNEISNLTTAIVQYQQQFRAYPGPFSNDQIDKAALTSNANGVPMWTFDPAFPGLYPPSPTPYKITGAENLAMGLLGGLLIVPGSPAPGSGLAFEVAFSAAQVGLGPKSLAASYNGANWVETNPKRYSPFLNTTSGTTNILYTGTGKFTDEFGHVADDSPIPEFVDRFPAHLPILYMRARVGAQFVVSNVQVTAWPPVYVAQYDLGEVTGYTGSNIGSIGAETISTPSHGLKGVAPGNPPYAIASSTPPPYLPFPIMDPAHRESPNNNGSNAAAYLINPTIAPLLATPLAGDTETGKPRAVDEYILISAGPDGIYGTTDDLTSFGDVVP